MKYLLSFTILAACLLIVLSSCSTAESPKLKVAATSLPHAEILEMVKSDLAEQQILLEIVVVEDYNTPNRALHDGEVDANFFQHAPFLDAQKADFGYRLESLAAVHLEPMALYSQHLKSLQDLKQGSTVAIPSDPSNQARALTLLSEQGLIQLKRSDAKTSLLDIKENPRHLQFVEIDSPLLARSLDDVSVAAITTNFALQAGLSPKRDALAMEGANSLFINIVAVREGESQRDDLQALRSALTSDKVKAFIEERYQGAVLPAF